MIENQIQIFLLFFIIRTINDLFFLIVKTKESAVIIYSV